MLTINLDEHPELLNSRRVKTFADLAYKLVGVAKVDTIYAKQSLLQTLVDESLFMDLVPEDEEIVEFTIAGKPLRVYEPC